MRVADSSVLHRSLRGDLPVAVRGSGVHLFDADGRDYIDACGGAAVSCLGHSHPAAIAAIRAQADQLAYAHSAFFTNEPAERLAADLVRPRARRIRQGARDVFRLRIGGDRSGA